MFLIYVPLWKCNWILTTNNFVASYFKITFLIRMIQEVVSWSNFILYILMTQSHYLNFHRFSFFILRIHRKIKSRLKVITSFKLLWSLKHNIAKGQLKKTKCFSFSIKKGYFKYSPSSNKKKKRKLFQNSPHSTVWSECISNRYVLYIVGGGWWSIQHKNTDSDTKWRAWI